ncbi:hypothetical protein HHK36_026303 [Tetracentron sinense]|uniref:Transposase MuDR plant domain-containing protein n=1 Tax=Tetracentron sinense TaxID=13715 RepID=A0A835D5C1_TETSI|nr:hypothetical protein HHK36_026303 [Tetracentron sinense]
MLATVNAGIRPHPASAVSMDSIYLHNLVIHYMDKVFIITRVDSDRYCYIDIFTDVCEAALGNQPSNMGMVFIMHCVIPESGDLKDVTSTDDVLQMFEIYRRINDIHLFLGASEIDSGDVGDNVIFDEGCDFSVDDKRRVGSDNENIISACEMVASTLGVSLEVGMLFDNVTEFREALRDYIIQEGFEIVRDKNEKVRVTAHCSSEGCLWRIHSSPLPDGGTYKIKTFQSDHTCVRATKNTNATSVWIAKKLAKRLCATPTMKIDGSEIHETYGIKTSKCCRAWEISGLPCKHSTACIARKRVNIEDYCDGYYSKETYLKAHGGTAHDQNAQFELSCIWGFSRLALPLHLGFLLFGFGLLQTLSSSPHLRQPRFFASLPFQLITESIGDSTSGACEVLSPATKIENEYGPEVKAFGAAGHAYMTWAANIATQELGTGVPWVMCKEDDAPETVVSPKLQQTRDSGPTLSKGPSRGLPDPSLQKALPINPPTQFTYSTKMSSSSSSFIIPAIHVFSALVFLLSASVLDVANGLSAETVINSPLITQKIGTNRTIKVDLDGKADFTSVQAAID